MQFGSKEAIFEKQNRFTHHFDASISMFLCRRPTAMFTLWAAAIPTRVFVETKNISQIKRELRSLKSVKHLENVT